MIALFHQLKPFFEDNYRELNMREYARYEEITPPTAAKILNTFKEDDLLLFRQRKREKIFRAHREHKLFIDLNRAYWRWKLGKLAEFLSQKHPYGKIILFGSLTKGEATQESDIDLYVETDEEIGDVSDFEKELKRTIDIHTRSSLKNKHLKHNIEQGVLLHE